MNKVRWNGVLVNPTEVGVCDVRAFNSLAFEILANPPRQNFLQYLALALVFALRRAEERIYWEISRLVLMQSDRGTLRN